MKIGPVKCTIELIVIALTQFAQVWLDSSPSWWAMPLSALMVLALSLCLFLVARVSFWFISIRTLNDIFPN